MKQYNQQNTLSSVALRTRITRNLAYRPTGLFVETQTGGTTAQSVVLAEDVKGRITQRDYTPNTGGVLDSFFLYDDQDRLLCETTSVVSSCPSSGSNIKNSHTASPAFTHAGDWKTLQRPIPGSTGLTHTFNISATSHQISFITQSTFGNTYYVYSSNGEIISDDNDILSHDTRSFFFDQRHNNNAVWSEYFGFGWTQYQMGSQFDARGRRVLKTLYDPFLGWTSLWYFYYDPFDRLTSVRYTVNSADPTSYQTFEFLWLGDRLTGYWQTDYPSATTSKRYVGTDETNRPIDMMSWPTSGDATRVWAINPSAWGFDTNAVGPAIYQPVLFAGQYQDETTKVYENDGVTVHRPGLALNALNGFRTYDPFVGGYLQVDSMSDETRSSYVYADSDPVGHLDPDGKMVNNGDYYRSGEFVRKSIFGEQITDGGKSYEPRRYGEGLSVCEALGFVGGVLGGYRGHVTTPGGGPWENSGLGVAVGTFIVMSVCALANNGHF